MFFTPEEGLNGGTRRQACIKQAYCPASSSLDNDGEVPLSLGAKALRTELPMATDPKPDCSRSTRPGKNPVIPGICVTRAAASLLALHFCNDGKFVGKLPQLPRRRSIGCGRDELDRYGSQPSVTRGSQKLLPD